jgi:toxin-antitoxin system PIN domain toxin
MTETLLDVNILIALLDANHQHHGVASGWVDGAGHLALCPLTINGCVRILGRADYPDGPGSVSAAIDRIESLASALKMVFWPDNVSLFDQKLFRRDRVMRPAQVTDLYLLALAVRKSGALATFDRAIPIDAVSGATKAHLVLLA